MGNFKIEIEAVGNHGTDRDAKQGEPISFGEPGPSNPDALAKQFADQLASSCSVLNARLIHWPDTTPIVDDLKSATRTAGSFAGGLYEKYNEEQLLKYFAFSHLTEGVMRETSRQFCHLAYLLVCTVPRSAERTVALRKLLEGKDAAVRAAMA